MHDRCDSFLTARDNIACMHNFIHIYTLLYIHIHTYIQVREKVYMRICLCMCMYVYVYTCLPNYIHTLHACIHTHMAFYTYEDVALYAHIYFSHTLSTCIHIYINVCIDLHTHLWDWQPTAMASDRHYPSKYMR